MSYETEIEEKTDLLKTIDFVDDVYWIFDGKIQLHIYVLMNDDSLDNKREIINTIYDTLGDWWLNIIMLNYEEYKYIDIF